MNESQLPQKTFLSLSQWLWVDLNWVWLLVAIAWGILLTTGHSHSHLLMGNGIPEMAHDTLMHSQMHSSMHSQMRSQVHSSIHQIWLKSLQASLFFLSSWIVMIVAMMLPSVLPVAKLFRQVSQTASDRHVAQLAFVSSYLTIWLAFAGGMMALSFIAPIASQAIAANLHQWLPQLALSMPSLSMLQGVTLLGVGLFQFTPMKQNCLKGCRSAAMVIAQYYQPGWVGGWHLGIQHGLYCLGCCWALMLSMVVMGMQDLVFMLLLTAIMTLERVWQYGDRLANVVGVGLIGWGIWLAIATNSL